MDTAALASSAAAVAAVCVRALHRLPARIAGAPHAAGSRGGKDKCRSLSQSSIACLYTRGAPAWAAPARAAQAAAASGGKQRTAPTHHGATAGWYASAAPPSLAALACRAAGAGVRLPAFRSPHHAAVQGQAQPDQACGYNHRPPEPRGAAAALGRRHMEQRAALGAPVGVHPRLLAPHPSGSSLHTTQHCADQQKEPFCPGWAPGCLGCRGGQRGAAPGPCRRAPAQSQA